MYEKITCVVAAVVVAIVVRFKEWKAEQDKVKVGDIVRFHRDARIMIVTKVDDDSICTVDNTGKVDTWPASDRPGKWGAYNVADRLKDLFKDI